MIWAEGKKIEVLERTSLGTLSPTLLTTLHLMKDVG